MCDEQQPPDDLISFAEGARLAGNCHRSTVLRWVLSGRLDGWRIGGRCFVSRAALLGLWRRVRRGERVPVTPAAPAPARRTDPRVVEELKRMGAY